MMPRFFIRTADFLRLVRVQNLLMVALTQYMTYWFLARTSPERDWRSFLDMPFHAMVLSTVMVAAAGYIINDYYDIKIDRINKPEKVVVGRVMRRRVALFSHMVFSLLGVLLAFWVSKAVGLVTFVVVCWLWLYSNRLKQLAFVGNVSVSAMTALTLILVGIYLRENNLYVYMYATFAFFVSLIREIIKDIEDRKGDAMYACRTLPIVWGVHKTKLLVLFLQASFLLVSLLLLLQIDNRSMYAYFTLLCLASLLFAYRVYKANATRTFSQLSSICKWVMLTGIMTMVFI